MYNATLKNYYVANVSGGKDSLYMFAHICANLDKYPLDAVVHFRVPYNYPWCDNVINYIKEKCVVLGIPFYDIKPSNTFEELYEKYGYPTRITRWCNSHLKMNCEKQLQELFKNKRNIVNYIGICANENGRCKNDPTKLYPLCEMGVYEETIWKWAKNQSIFNDFYKYNRRQGCLYCPMQAMANSKYNSVYYPELYEYFMTLAEQTEEKRSKELVRNFSVWSSNPKYDTAYRRQRIEQMELKEIEKW